MATKYPVKTGYKYSFYRTRLGEPLHQPGYEFDLTDPNCYLLKTEYNNLHDPHLKSFFYNKTRHSQLLSQGFITKDNKVKCSLQEFNQYNNYIQHRMIALNKQYIKEQGQIKKQIDSINRSNAKLMERIHKREQYKTQLLKKMEKNWRKNDLQLLSQMRRERLQKLHPIEEMKKPVSGMFIDSEDVSSLSSFTDPSINTQKVKTVSITGTSKKKNYFLPVTTPKKSIKSDPIVHDWQPTKGICDDLADIIGTIKHTDFSSCGHIEETVSDLDTSKDITISSARSTSMPTQIKLDLSVYDLENLKDTYSMMLQKVFDAQSDYLSSVSENLVEVVFNKITSIAPERHLGFTPIKTVAKETWHDIRGKSPCRYLFSRLEVMSTATEMVQNVLSKWHEIAVHKFGTKYEEIFEEQTPFKELYQFFSCANNLEEMYKATLPIASESIQESSEEIVKIVLSHLEIFAKSRSEMPSKQISDSAVVASMKHGSPKSDTLKTRSLSDMFRSHGQPQSFLEKELENLATSIKQPEHKVHIRTQGLIETLLNVIETAIDFDKRLETGNKFAISAQEKFLMYKYLERNYVPSKRELLRSYSRILLLPKSHVSRESLTSPESENQVFKAVIEEVNVPGMAICLEDDDKYDKTMADLLTQLGNRQCRGSFENVNTASCPLNNQGTMDYNCFLLNIFNCDHLVHSHNEFMQPLKLIDNLVSETLLLILKDLNYPIPEHLCGFTEYPNNIYDAESTIRCQKDSNSLLLPSDIRSFSHHMFEYILKMLYVTSSYEKWKETFQSIFSQVKTENNSYSLTDCNQVLSPLQGYRSPDHIIWEEMTQTISAKIESFILLKFKTYVTSGEVVDADLVRSIPGFQTELEIHSTGIVTRLLGEISESISQQQAHDQLNTNGLFFKDDASITHVLISSLLDHICNDQFNSSSEEWCLRTSTSEECLETGCALHNVYNKAITNYPHNFRLLDISSSALQEAFKQIMDTIQAKYHKCVSVHSTLIGLETDLSKCCQESVSFLQMEMNVLSKCIVEYLINILCSAKQKIKREKSLLKYQGFIITGICENSIETISNLVLRDVFQKFRGFISLAVKAIHPSSKNMTEEIYFPGMFDQQNLLDGPTDAVSLKGNLKRTRPKSNLYRHSNHLSHEMLRVIQNQLEKISNDVRKSILEDEDVKSESSGLLVFEMEQMSLHSSFSKDESVNFPQDTCVMQNIETNIRRNILHTICVYVRRKESVTPEISGKVKKVLLMIFKQLLIDLSLPIKLTHFSEIRKIHQRLLSETLLTSSRYVNKFDFCDSEVNDLSADILTILLDMIYASNRRELRDQTDFANGRIPDHTYGVKSRNLLLTKLINFVISKIITLFCQSVQKSSQSETRKDKLTVSSLESYAQELADTILYQAEEHLCEQMMDVCSPQSPSNSNIANRLVSVLIQSLKKTFPSKEEPNTLPSSDTDDTQEKATTCNAIEIAKMVEMIIKDAIDNLETINLSDTTLDICAKNLASSVPRLIQTELEEESGSSDKNALATEIVNIILNKFDIKGISSENSSTNAPYNVDSIYNHTVKYEMSPKSCNVSCPDPEYSVLIHQVELVLHEVQTKIVLELKVNRCQLSVYDNQPNESLSENLCETFLGFTRSDIEFVAKDIVEIIIAKLCKYLHDIRYYPNLSYEEHYFMSLEPKQTRYNSYFQSQRNRRDPLDESFVDECLLSNQLVAVVGDKTTAFATAVALKCKPKLTNNLNDENVGTFLARLELESYAKDIVMKVMENIKHKSKSKLLHIQSMSQEEDIQVTHFVHAILQELSFGQDSSSIVSENAPSCNECTKYNIKNGETVDHPNPSPGLSSSSRADKQIWFRVTGVESLTNSYTQSNLENGGVVNQPEVFTSKMPSLSKNIKEQRLRMRDVILSTSSSAESDFDNGEAMDHPRASTPKPPPSSSSNKPITFPVPDVSTLSCSNTESENEIREVGLLPQIFTKRSSSSPSDNEQRSYNMRLHFL